MTGTGGESVEGIRSTMRSMLKTRGRARQFWQVFDTSLVPMVMVDGERRYQAANTAARLVFRLRLHQFLSRRVDDLTPPHLLPTMHDRWSRLMREGCVAGPYEVGFPDGSELSVVYGALANFLPGQHLVVFAPADWPGEELGMLQKADEPRVRGPLSPREREVLTMMALGDSLQQMADELSLSVATVRTHIRNALRKLGAHNRVHAIALAMQGGLIDVPRRPPAG